MAGRREPWFAHGWVQNAGNVGGALNRTFVAPFIETQPKADDMLLRFFDLCPNYARYRAGCCRDKERFVQRLLTPAARLVAQRVAGTGAPVSWDVSVGACAGVRRQRQR